MSGHQDIDLLFRQIPSSTPRTRRSSWRWPGHLLVVLLLTAPGWARAQYRPPPATAAERLTATGDEARIDAGKALVGGDKGRAKRLFTEAMDSYGKALKENPDHLPAAAGFGEVASTLGDHERVVQVLGPVNAKYPDSVDVGYHLGISLFKLKRYADAVALLEKVVVARKPEHLLAHFYLGRFYLHEQRPEDAIVALQGYLKLRPEKLAKNDHQILEMLGFAYLTTNQLKEARASFEKAQAGRPESVQLQMGLAAVLEREGRMDAAIQALNALSSRFPTEPAPRERVAWLLLAAGQLEHAQTAASSALRLQPTATVHQVLGEIALARNDFKTAEASFRSALKMGPQLSDARYALAKAVQKQGRNDEAISLLEEANRGGLDTVDLWAALGSVYRRAGRFQEAVQAHQKVVQRSPTLPRGHVLLGADYFATGEWDLAIDQYTRALKIDAANVTAKHWLAMALAHRARVLARSGQLEDATRDLKRALDLERTAPIGRSLGALLLARKQYEPAVEVLQKSTQLPGANWKDHLLLGYGHLGAKNGQAALAAFERAATGATDPGVLSDVYAGWSLAKLELGEFDTAVAKLQETGKSGTAIDLVRDNLPLALVRRAFNRLREGDTEGASTDVDAAEKLVPARSEAGRLARLARALVELDRARFSAASESVRTALAGKPGRWAKPNTLPLISAYVDYRSGNIPAARKRLARTARSLTDHQQAFVTLLDRSLDRREAELAYARGALPVAARAIQSALKDDPLNPWVQHNAACVDYRKKRYQEAAASWAKVENTIPEAALNLGIDAQVRRKEMDRAVEFYARYVATGGPRAALVGRWKERLQMIYGIAEPARPARPSQGAEGSTDKVATDQAGVAQ